MKRLSSIRAKLLLIVLVPTLAMTALGIRQYVSEASQVRELEQTTQIVGLFESVTPTIDAIGRFRVEMARSDAPPPFGAGTPRAAVTESINRFQERATGLSTEGSPRFQAALSKAAGLTRAIDLNAPLPRPADLDAAVSALVELNGVVAYEGTDPALSRDVASIAALSEYLVVTRQDERVLLEYSQDGIDSGRHALLVANRTRGKDALRVFEAIAPPASVKAVNALADGPAMQKADDTINRLILDGPASTTKLPVDEAFTSVDATSNGVHTNVSDLSKRVSTSAADARDSAQRDLYVHLVLIVGGIVAAVAVAVVVARSISSRLRRVAVAAQDIADVRLPNFLQAVENPDLPMGDIDADLPTLGKSGNDEVGQVMDAFGKVQETTVAVAREHAYRLRHGIDSTFVNLARRNQTAVARQLEAISWLRDHEVLDDEATSRLDLVDQLGHNLRRNAENLLVLSGVELGSNRAQKVEAGVLVARAAREVGDVRRVTTIGMSHLEIAGQYVDDVSRMLVELLDNAFQFSPPTERVIVSFDEGRAGQIVVSVRDHGLGMSEEQLEQANALLGGEANVGLEMSRRLGLTVVGAIARRIGATATVSAGNGGGITARITLGVFTFVWPDDPSLPAEDEVDISDSVKSAASKPATAAPSAAADQRSREVVLARLAKVDPKSLVDQYR